MSWLDLPRALRQRPALRLGQKLLRVWRRGGLAGLWWQLRHLDGQTRAYARWLKRQRADEPEERARLHKEIAALPSRPLISIVMPVCDPPERWLRRAIASVRDQIYPHWELCIADDASCSTYVRELLRTVADDDPRILVIFRESRGHICAATRSALQLAGGEFITFLDHDDELSPLALAYVATEFGRFPNVDVLYSDEDIIGTDGRRYNPYFKPDWNPELLRAQNYLCHLSIYRADLIDGLDMFRPEVQGSQDWDLALRATEQAKCIRHLPYILYHWRSIPGSTAHSDTAKRYALEAGRCAVQGHLTRCGETAEVELLPFGHLCVRRPPPSELRLTLIVIAQTSDAQPLTAHVQQAPHPGLEVLVAAGGNLAPDDSLPELLNQRAIKATGDILIFVDSRCRPATPDWLEILAAEAARPDIGAVGARLLLANNRVWHAGYLLDPKGIVQHPYRGAPAHFAGQRNRALLQQNVSAVSASCLAVKRDLFERLNGFDLASGCHFDVDFCLRLQENGQRNIWMPQVTLVLHADNEPPKGNVKAPLADRHALLHMQTRWRDQLNQDPAGNRELALAHNLPVPGSKQR